VSGRGISRGDGQPGSAYAARHAAIGRRARYVIPAGIGRSIVATVGFNITMTGAGALSGVLIARATGPAMRGEYTAVTSWLGFALMLGELGLPIALCFYVAKDPSRAPSYVTTARAMMLASGALAMVCGLVLAQALGRGHPGLTMAYRIAFICLPVSCIADSYTFALMGRALALWNQARVGQPLVAVAAVIVLWHLRMLTLDGALLVLLGSLLVQLGWSYLGCRRVGLVPGRLSRELTRPLASYGVTQIAAVAPQAINAYLDQLVLSVTVSPAALGCYSIAVSITLLPAPLVSAIGYVLLPTLAAGKTDAAQTRQIQRKAVLVSLGLASAILLPLALAAPRLVPLVFGPAYQSAVPLVWILAPGGIFLSCGQMVANLLRGLNRQLVVARAEGIAVIFTLLLLAALLPVIGVTGAAIASTVPYGISLTLMLRQLWRTPNVTDTNVTKTNVTDADVTDANATDINATDKGET
jgi:O-antigen/teichoic acid export membrane protein